MSPEEKETVKIQITEYRQYQALLSNGLFYRLLDPADNAHCAWMMVSEGREEALVNYFKILSDNKRLPLSLRLRGLDPQYQYRDNRTGETYSGVTLMNAGLPLPCLWGDFLSHIVHLTPAREE
jgi:alpha-galactosidase